MNSQFLVLYLSLSLGACGQLVNEKPDNHLATATVQLKPDEKSNENQKIEAANNSVSIDQISITDLPFTLSEWLFQGLTNEGQYLKIVEQIKSESSKAPVISNLDRLEIEHQEDFIRPPLKYQYELFYQRLPPLNDSIEVLIFYNESIYSEDPYITLNIIAYNITRNMILGTLTIFDGGIGLDGIIPYSGVHIDQFYNIDLIEYVVYEDEISEIKRSFKVTTGGKIIKVQ